MYEFFWFKMKHKKDNKADSYMQSNGPLHQMGYHHVNNVNNLSGLNQVTWQDAALKSQEIFIIFGEIILLPNNAVNTLPTSLSLLLSFPETMSGQLITWRPIKVQFQLKGFGQSADGTLPLQDE